MIEVIRTDTEHMRVGEKWFHSRTLADAAYHKLIEAGSRNPGFDMPPFFYTGCPYGEALLALHCEEVNPPEKYRIMTVPSDGKKPWAARDPIWPEVFGVDPSLHWFAGEY